MHEHAVVIAGGGPTGLMLAGELALAGIDVAIIEHYDLGGGDLKKRHALLGRRMPDLDASLVH